MNEGSADAPRLAGGLPEKVEAVPGLRVRLHVVPRRSRWLSPSGVLALSAGLATFLDPQSVHSVRFLPQSSGKNVRFHRRGIQSRQKTAGFAALS